jgi:hypothetical protein
MIWALLLALAAVLAPLAAESGPAKGPAAPAVASLPGAIALVPGGGPVHLEADDQDGDRLLPSLFTWAVPAGAMIGVQQDATGWLVSAPQGAAPGNYAIPVQYNPNPALSPVAAIAIGKPISRITIVVSPPAGQQ